MTTQALEGANEVSDRSAWFERAKLSRHHERRFAPFERQRACARLTAGASMLFAGESRLLIYK